MSRALTMSSFSNCPAACMSSTASAAKTCLRSAANTGEDGSSKPALQRLGTFTALSTRHHYNQKHIWPLRTRAPACHRIRGGRRETNHATSLRSVHKVEEPLLALFQRRLRTENDCTGNTGPASYCNQACQTNPEAQQRSRFRHWCVLQAADARLARVQNLERAQQRQVSQQGAVRGIHTEKVIAIAELKGINGHFPIKSERCDIGEPTRWVTRHDGHTEIQEQRGKGAVLNTDVK